MSVWLWITYLIAVSVSFMHVYSFMESVFPHWLPAALAAIVIDCGIIAFLMTAVRQAVKTVPRHLAIVMVIFFGIVAMVTNSIDAYNGGSGIILTTDSIKGMDAVTFTRFLLTGILAPFTMIICAIFIFAPELLKGVQKVDATVKAKMVVQPIPENNREVQPVEKPGNFR